MDIESTPAIAETAPPRSTTRGPTPAAASPATTANVETRPSCAPNTTSRMEPSRSMRLGSVSSSDMWARPSMRRMVAAITPPPADTAPSARRAGAAVAAAIAGAGAGALPSKVASAWRNMSRWWRSRSSATWRFASVRLAGGMRALYSAGRRFVWRPAPVIGSRAMKAALVLGLAALTLLAPAAASAVSIQEALLLATPAVALVTAEVRGEVTMNCGRGTLTVRPTPFVETGTGWFVDGTGYLITNAHVVDPVHRMPPWVLHELKKKAIDQACGDPGLRAQGLMRGQNPNLEEAARREATARALATAQVTTFPQLSVLLSSGLSLKADVVKFSPPLAFDLNGKPVADFGRDLALLRVKDGVYPAIRLGDRDPQIGDPVHIIGFPGVVQSHELLGKSFEASVTNGAISGFKQDAIGQDIIQTDAAAAHGNSGWSAVGDDASLVGVMTFTTLSTSGSAIVQGFNFLIPARDVKKFLAGTPVTLGQSKFNDVWRAGLDALCAERSATAVRRIAEANALQPNLADVKRVFAEAERKVKNPPPRPFPWAWATLGVTLLSVGIYGGMFGRRWWKNRFRILPAQVIAAIESGRNPQLVDVRTKTDFETSPLRLPGAVRLDPDAVLAGRPEAEPAAEREQLIVTYDTSPGETTAEKVANALRGRGFKHVRILKGGLGGGGNAPLPGGAEW